MFFMARQAAATLAGRLGRTSTISTFEGSTGPRVYNGKLNEPPRLAVHRVRLFLPLPPRLARLFSALVVLAWVLQMGLLLRQTFYATPLALAADLASYSGSAQWRGIYYRGDKIGFSVGQTTATDDGYEIREDARLKMTLVGAETAVRMTSRAVVDRGFALRRFLFSLDPGTGPTTIEGVLEGKRLDLTIRNSAGVRRESRDLAEPPALSLNLPRTLAARGLATGQKLSVSVFDPATLRNSRMNLEVQAREVVRAEGRPVPAFRVEGRLAGVTMRSWITDTGEVVKEESPMGLLVVRESPEQAQALAVPGSVQADLLEAAALVPRRPQRIDDPRTVATLRLRIDGLSGLDPADLEGAGQSASSGTFELHDPRDLAAGPAPDDLDHYLHAETFLESDAPEIRAEAEKATAGAATPRLRAERLTRHVHAIVEKRPTVSLPSALEVLKTRIGDCNEHTALYVAMARSIGLPARIAAGLVYLKGAFYYHAWPEVFVTEAAGRGLWLPVDPTLNQFPADATHVRLARGGLDKQAAIVGLVGRAKLDILGVELRPGAVPVLVGREAADLEPLALDVPHRAPSARGCWSQPRRNAP
jgi:transglutaminase-like putative cysteine protease